MAVSSTPVDLALKVIRDANIAHPGEELLECFICDSVDQEQAANYLLQKCPPTQTVIGLAAFLCDWTKLVSAFMPETIDRVRDRSILRDITGRDGAKCCVSGLGSSFFDPLIVVRIFSEPPKQFDAHLREMLGAFLSPLLLDFVLSPKTGNNYENLWLVRRSVAEAFPRGYFHLLFRGNKDYRVSINTIGGPTVPSVVDEVQPLRRGRFTDHSTSGVALPAHTALQILGRFSKSTRWVCVAREIAKKTTLSARFAFPRLRLPTFCTTALIALWAWVPTAIRIAAYHRLTSLGRYLYGPTCSLRVQRLPFGLYLKARNLTYHGSLENENGALQLVRRHTQIVVPRPLDLVSSGEDSYLLMSAVPGHHIGLCLDSMSDDEVAQLLRGLREWLVQLRSIPSMASRGYEISNAVGKGCYDHRISAGVEYDAARGDFFGPFRNEEEFNSILRCGALPDVVHRTGHKVVFTHGDLNMRNILVKDGRLAGIVDWENSGWYPSYWDYTKAHFITKHTRRWLKIVDKVFEELGDYQSELETEKKLWEYCF